MKNNTTFSFEFFPPKTKKGSDSLFLSIRDLSTLKPDYVSVTYGAGGSTRQLTHDLIVRIKEETNISVVSHLTCVGSTKEAVHSILEKYRANGITRILALKGDPPMRQEDSFQREDDFLHAVDLVKYIRNNHADMNIGVAGFPEGHPATPNRLKEMEYLKEKADAGADYICTQLFYENRDFYDFCERCEIAGIHVPIIAGLMPITSLETMNRIAELSAGSRIPAKLLKLLYRADSSEQIERAGIHWAAEQVRDLIDHKVKGIHFYTLNKSEQIKRICKSIGLSSFEQVNK